jgi:hypothetical protein
MKKHACLLLLFTFILTGCGGPSTAEITKAIQDYDRAQLTKQLAQLTLAGNEAATVAIKISLPKPNDLKVEHLKHKTLKELDNGDYVTNVSYILRVGDQTEKVTTELTLTPAQSGWQVIRSLPL